MILTQFQTKDAPATPLPLIADYDASGNVDLSAMGSFQSNWQYNTISQEVNYYADLIQDPESAKELLKPKELASLEKYTQQYPNNVTAAALATFRDEHKRQALEDKNKGRVDAALTVTGYAAIVAPIVASFVFLPTYIAAPLSLMWGKAKLGLKEPVAEKVLNLFTANKSGSTDPLRRDIDNGGFQRTKAYMERAEQNMDLAKLSDKMLYRVNGGDIGQSTFKETREWANRRDRKSTLTYEATR